MKSDYAVLEHIDHISGHSINVFENISSGFKNSYHYHPEFEMTLITKSSGTRFVGTHIDHFNEGDFILLGSQIAHAWRSFECDQNHVSEAYVCQFKPLIMDVLEVLPEADKIHYLLTKSAYALKFSLSPVEYQRVVDFYQQLICANGIQRFQLLLSFLTFVSELEYKPILKFSFVKNNGFYTRIQKVLDYMFLNYTQIVRLEDVARVVSLSEGAFSRFFSKEMGRSFSKYLLELRLNHAVNLLQETDWPIFQIAECSGFTNLANFNRQFKRFYKRSPRQYRLQMRELSQLN
ncbi:MAG: AraC family transcriptional regulator [Lentisphaeria bacterium]|nr:AraC family transcriptional regulator [Lentisphaeria bacterium]